MSVEEIARELGGPTGRSEIIPYDRKAYTRALAGDMRLQYAHLAGADLRGVTLAGSNLQGANLSYANLSGANLDGVLLDSANLEGANLTGASLKNASLEDVQLFEANLTEADLEGAILAEGRLGNTNFSRANLRKANLYRVGATEATFEGADLEDALLSRAFLTNADFRGARLRNATMTNLRSGEGRFDQGVSVRFDNADLMGADLENSRFKDAKFTNADLSGANLEDTLFTECSLIDADLTKARLRGARFNECAMRGAVGTPAERVRDRSASLAGLDFAGLDLHGVNFSGRDLHDARFTGALLSESVFAGCDLTRCDFSKASLSWADFSRAVLGEAVFKLARARRADFTKAQMSAVNLDRADVSEANFSEANLAYAQMLMVVAPDANFEYTILTDMKGTQGNFNHARFASAHIEKVDFSGARLFKADFSGAELREVKFNEADLTGARLEDTVVREDVSVAGAKMDAATRALFFVPRSAYGKMAGPILKMDKPDAPTKAAEFKKKYPREFERLKAETGGRDLLPAVKEAIRAKYRSARPWIITRGHYTGQTQRYCGSPNDVLKFNIALDDASFTPAQQDSLRKLAETSRRSGHPHELGDLFTIGWVRYCPDNAERTWLVEEVQSDVSVVRQQLKDEKEFPREFREVVDILAPIAERFYYDALGVVFELAAEKGYEVEMLDYPAKQKMGSPRSVYTDLPREMGMQKKPKSALEEGAVSGVGAVWAYRPNPKRRRGGRK